MPSPEQSRPSIDDAQQKLESLDGAHDGRFAQGDTLKQTYIDRVNDVQARIRQLRTQADTMKSAKSKGWEELETACQAQEQKLYDTLKAIVSPEQLHKQQQIVEEKINEALRKLSEIHPETSTEATDAHVQLETAMDALHIAVKDVQTIEDSIRSTIALLANDARDYKSQ